MSLRSRALSCVISSYLDEAEEEEQREKDMQGMSEHEKFLYNKWGGGQRGLDEVESYRASNNVSDNSYYFDDDEDTEPVERNEYTGKYKVDVVKEIREKGFFGFLFGS